MRRSQTQRGRQTQGLESRTVTQLAADLEDFRGDEDAGGSLAPSLFSLSAGSYKVL